MCTLLIHASFDLFVFFREVFMTAAAAEKKNVLAVAARKHQTLFSSVGQDNPAELHPREKKNLPRNHPIRRYVLPRYKHLSIEVGQFGLLPFLRISSEAADRGEPQIVPLDIPQKIKLYRNYQLLRRYNGLPFFS